MGTSGGEPRVLLNALKPMLGVLGDIRTQQEVLRVVGMMKDAEKLMSRCVYLNILKSTCREAMKSEEKRNTLEKFLVSGGWGILNKWLHEFTKAENFPVLLELIDVLKVTPVTVDLLKQGNTGKIMKQMTKLENADVKKNAGLLIKQWKEMIRGGSDKKTIPNENENGVEDNVEQNTKRLKDYEGRGPPEKRPKIKLIDPLPKLADSSGFMNALNAAAPVSLKKKRRNSNTKTSLPLDEILNNKSNDKKVKLEVESPGVFAESPLESEPPLVEDSLSLGNFQSPAVEAANLAFAADTSEDPIPDENSIARKKNKKKRNITWAKDEELVKICYFELQEGEKKSRHVENFSQARHMELMLEKRAMRSARKGGEDKMVELIQWSRLIPIDNAGVPNIIPGEKSKEKFIQAEREKSVLAFIFLSKDSLPDTPVEPDFDADEHGSRTQPKVIPHDEEGTLFPVPKVAKEKFPKKIEKRSSDENQLDSPTNPISQTPTTGVSTAVQNIMSQLLRVNNQYPAPEAAPQNPIPPSQPPRAPGMGGPRPHRPSDVMRPGMDNMRHPVMMQNSYHGEPRFRGRPPMHRGGFGPRPRWNAPPPRPEGEWDNFNHHNPDFHNGGFDGPPPHGGYDNFHRGRARGFRHMGRGRSRGDWNRGRGGYDVSHRGRRNENEDERGDRGRIRDGPPKKSICQHFQAPRGCRMGDRCNFLHVKR